MLQFFDGWETYLNPIQKWDAVSTPGGESVFVEIGTGRNGGNCLSSRGCSNNVLVQKNFSIAQTMFCGVAIWVGGAGGENLFNWLSGSASQISLTIDNTGHLNVSRFAGVTIGTSVQTLSFRAWHYVEMFVKIDPTVGIVTVNVDGVQWINLTNINTVGFGNAASVGGIQLNLRGSIASDSPWLADDFYLADITGAFNVAFLGDVSVKGLVPAGNGTQLDYTMNATAWVATTIKGVGQTILDSNGNLQRVLSVSNDAKTGGSAPSWAITVGVQTVDNHVTWVCLGAESQFLLVNQSPPENAGQVVKNTIYAIGQMVWDPNRNLQICTTGGLASSSAPTWNSIVGGTTTNGATVWLNLGPVEDTFLSSNTVGNISRFTFPSITASSIKGVGVNLFVRKDDVGVRSVRGAVKSGASVGDTGTDLVLSQTYKIIQAVSESDPATGVAWTQAGFNAAEFGIKTTA